MLILFEVEQLNRNDVLEQYQDYSGDSKRVVVFFYLGFTACLNYFAHF